MNNPDATTPGKFSVMVVIPPEPGVPDAAVTVRHVGPYTAEQAHIAVAAFEAQRPGSVVDGTVFQVVPYWPDVEQLDPTPPIGICELAAAMDEEPDGPGGGYGFPDLYARLRAAYGTDQASAAWQGACQYLDWLTTQEEQAAEAGEQLAAQAERAEAAHRAARLDAARDQVRKIAARYGSTLVTEPVIDAAAGLCLDLLDTGARHSVRPDDWEVRLADAALDAVTNSLRRTRPDDVNVATSLLQTLADRLAELGQPVTLWPGQIGITLPYLPSTPVRFPLVVTLTKPNGWDVVPRTGTYAPAVAIDAPFTPDGTRAVADTLAALNRGELGNPFARE